MSASSAGWSTIGIAEVVAVACCLCVQSRKGLDFERIIGVGYLSESTELKDFEFRSWRPAEPRVFDYIMPHAPMSQLSALVLYWSTDVTVFYHMPFESWYEASQVAK